MIYSVNEKRRMDNILKAFDAYISNHTFFDIVYSDKVGYFRIQVENPDDEGLIVIRSVDKLLDVLFNEIINDILYTEGDVERNIHEMSEEEAEEAQRRIARVLETLGEDADYCMDFLDTYIENYPNNDIQD